MRTITKTIELYTFKEASSELRDKIRETTFIDGWHFEHCLEEQIATLKKFADFIYADLDYSISVVPCRGEFISLKPNYSFSSMYESIQEFINDKKDCPLTGVCYDESLRHYLKNNPLNDSGLKQVLDDYLNMIHDEYEYSISDAALIELCESNEYEFDKNGKLY